MTKYKHGNWYCKHANEAEAREIIERAVDSGATNKGGWKGTAVTYFYGVFDGYVYGCAPEKYINGNQYTIEQVREKFPLLSELQMSVGPHFEHEQKEVVRSDVKVSIGGNPDNWDGKGLPPVGTVCEALHTGGWYKCEILKHNTTNVGVKSAACDFGFTLAWSTNFRPLRSDREVWVSEAQKHCTEFGGNQLGNLFDALKSGDLKAPQ